MDAIAGELGFYSPIFDSQLRRGMKSAKRLSFDVVEQVRASFCPQASFHSTMVACAKRCDQPVICLEIGLCLKDAEQQQVKSKQTQLFASEPPMAKLRVISAVPNSAARERKLRIDYHMQVPRESALFGFFHSGGGDLFVVEDLAAWKHSDGKSLPSSKVRIEARQIGDSAVALVSALPIRRE